MNHTNLIEVENFDATPNTCERVSIDSLLQRDPDESLWDRLHWHFGVLPFSSGITDIYADLKADAGGAPSL